MFCKSIWLKVFSVCMTVAVSISINSHISDWIELDAFHDGKKAGRISTYNEPKYWLLKFANSVDRGRLNRFHKQINFKVAVYVCWFVILDILYLCVCKIPKVLLCGRRKTNSIWCVDSCGAANTGLYLSLSLLIWLGDNGRWGMNFKISTKTKSNRVCCWSKINVCEFFCINFFLCSVFEDHSEFLRTKNNTNACGYIDFILIYV